MKISYHWLKRHLDLPCTPEELVDIFPRLGFEVESFEQMGVPITEKIVVGKVLTKVPHPNADKLNLCQVQVSADPKNIEEIVCGAHNFIAGNYVPVALIGASLPGDFKIKETKIRGVASRGMICSESELGLTKSSQGILVLPGEPTLGTPIYKLFEDKSDTVYVLELTANRGDCASHLGIARELSAYFNLPLKQGFKPKRTLNFSSQVPFIKTATVKASEACPLYTLYAIEGIRIAPSPAWMQKALQAVGIRPINNIVDITNWVMLECGQPLHAFDLDKVADTAITVRMAQSGEMITTLDGKERVLDSSMLVITDSQGPIGIAGLMGDASTQVSNLTVNILLESAVFCPHTIRQAARNLALHSESAYRFSRGIDGAFTKEAAHIALELIQELAGGNISTTALQIGLEGSSPKKIEFNPTIVNQKSGLELKSTEIQSVLERLHFKIEKHSEEAWLVQAPSFRAAEVTRPIDLVEECIRLHGTDAFTGSAVYYPALLRDDAPLTVFTQKVEDFLCAQGFFECYNYSLCNAQAVGLGGVSGNELENPLTQEHTHVRSSLLPGLLENLSHNHKHGQNLQKCFETGRIWQSVGNQSQECHAVCFLLTDEPLASSWKAPSSIDFFTVKAIAEQLLALGNFKAKNALFETLTSTTQAGSVWQLGHTAQLGNLETLGLVLTVGLCNIKQTQQLDIHGFVHAAELRFFPNSFEKKLEKKHIFTPISPYPSVQKDLALLLSTAIPAEQVKKELCKIIENVINGTCTLDSIHLFDLYQDAHLEEQGQKSLAFTLSFRSNSSTLPEETVTSIFEAIQAAIHAQTNYRVRSGA